MSGAYDQRLILLHLLQIFLNQAVLHPVLAHLSRLAICNKLIGIQSHIKIQIIINHELDCLAGQASASVCFDRLCLNQAVRAETVTINFPSRLQLLIKFLRQFSVIFFRNITERILDRQLFIAEGKLRLPLWRPAHGGVQRLRFRQPFFQPDFHKLFDFLVCHFLTSVLIFHRVLPGRPTFQIQYGSR